MAPSLGIDLRPDRGQARYIICRSCLRVATARLLNCLHTADRKDGGLVIGLKAAAFTQLINLAGKLVEHQSIYQQLNSAREKGNLAALALITARGLLKDLLDNRRIVNIPTSDAFPAWLTDYEDAVIATREKSVLSEKCSALNSLITVILSPVATQIEGLSWSVINNMLSEY